MVTAKLLNYTFVRRSESSMQIAPPKGDDDVAVPCLKEKGRHEAASQPASQPASSLHAIIRFQYWTRGKFFPSLSLPRTILYILLPIRHCPLPILRARRAVRPSLEPFHKTAPFILYDLHLAEICTASSAT